ncbi:DUF1127 domain-containing protein [Pseudodonghicola flavimaris]|uniref:DUF1127 domain-containing protein n=1 Tax=Pseudodonghicola flavimaris TaxID=3050036 RepID=A0ABT7F2W4_9RHOB|nr:DUF1127 domain-containing protein [Pseudodonghicola flavimaris]MDK3018964.1 DUF1127 domain-containing protein [Pseudodonghicola flavimaris]
MAHSTAPAALPAPMPTVFSFLSALFGSESDILSPSRQAAEIADLSDAELADRGLRRGDIGRFVMHDSFWR